MVCTVGCSRWGTPERWLVRETEARASSVFTLSASSRLLPFSFPPFPPPRHTRAVSAVTVPPPCFVPVFSFPNRLCLPAQWTASYSPAWFFRLADMVCTHIPLPSRKMNKLLKPSPPLCAGPTLYGLPPASAPHDSHGAHLVSR